MKFGVMLPTQTPRPIDTDQWHERDSSISTTRRWSRSSSPIGSGTVISSSPASLPRRVLPFFHAREVFLAAAAARTKHRLGAAASSRCRRSRTISARVAERVAAWIVSRGLVEFGTGEGATTTEIGGFSAITGERSGVGRGYPRMPADDDHGPLPGCGEVLQRADATSSPARCETPPRRCGWPPSSLGNRHASRPSGIGAMGVGFETPGGHRGRVTVLGAHSLLSPTDQRRDRSRLHPGGNVFCAGPMRKPSRRGSPARNCLASCSGREYTAIH